MTSLKYESEAVNKYNVDQKYPGELEKKKSPGITDILAYSLIPNLCTKQHYEPHVKHQKFPQKNAQNRTKSLSIRL